jgi:hypothetical protein
LTIECDIVRWLSVIRRARARRGEIPITREWIPDAVLGLAFEDAFGELYQTLLGEFDPGSGRTLAACLTHASRGGWGNPLTGERVRNT